MATLSSFRERPAAEPFNVPPELNSAPSRPVYFNGKFYSGALNGVHRTADRLIREVDALCAQGEAQVLDLRLLLPSRPNWAPEFAVVRKTVQRLGHHQAWEQFVLPLRAADGVLVNLANLAPLAHGRKLSMIHDAQFLISPESFPLKVSLGYRLLTPLIARTSARVLTVSEYARDSLAAFGVSPHRRTEVIYNGADHILEPAPDLAVLARLGLEEGAYALLFGTPAVYKNLQVAFAAFDPGLKGVRLVVVGGGPEVMAAAGLHPPPGVVYAGKASDGELRALYAHALCLLFPSRTEGFGLPPAEAMTCGCPVVAAPAGAMPEVCRDAALYADVFDPAGWAAQVRALRDQPRLRRAKVKAGLARAADFTWRRAGLRLLREIERLARRPAPTGRPRVPAVAGRGAPG